MKVLVRSIALLLAGAATFHAGMAQTPTLSDSNPSFGDLVAEFENAVPGQPFQVALRIQMAPKWHVYWMNPGDSGLPPTLNLNLPEGWEKSELDFPFPDRYAVGPLMSYGYEDEVLYFFTLTPPADTPIGTTVNIGGEANWLVCRELCLPDGNEVSLSITFAENAGAPTEFAERFAETRRMLPVKIDGLQATAELEGETIILRVVAPAGVTWAEGEYYFFASTDDIVEHPDPQPVTIEGDVLILQIPTSIFFDPTATETISGLLLGPEGFSWTSEEGIRAAWIETNLGNAEGAAAAAGTTSAGSPAVQLGLVSAIGLALLGGLILNIMPCVFPVLSIKVLSFVNQAGHKHSLIRLHGLAFAAGVVLSFWVLAGLMIALQAAGNQVGWAFQMQNPYFTAFLVLLMVAIGLNLLGVFEIGHGLTRLGSVGGSGGGLGSSFWVGVLAVIVATPCTAPFMAAAVGWAFSQSPLVIFIVMTALGVGMSVPYLVLTIAPKLIDLLPKPGPWMESFKQILAFPMFLVAAWLLSVFASLTSTQGLTALLFGAIFLGMAIWAIRRWPLGSLTSGRKVTAGVFTSILLLSGVYGLYQGPRMVERRVAAAPVASPDQLQPGEWYAFSLATMDSLKESGKPFFIDFTADWCINCKVNKSVALDRPAVQESFRDRGVIKLVADWTQYDQEITDILNQHGRQGIPFYLLYPGNGGEPIILPELLTEGIMLRELQAVSVGTTQVAQR